MIVEPTMVPNPDAHQHKSVVGSEVYIDRLVLKHTIGKESKAKQALTKMIVLLEEASST